MKTNMQTIYAVKIMAYLYKKNVPCTSTEIGMCVGTSPEFAQNILSKLRRNKSLITATKGARGGYTIAKSPKEIKLSDIFEAVEDYPLLHNEKENGSVCNDNGGSSHGEKKIREYFKFMQETIDMLFVITLEELLTRENFSEL